MPELLGRNSKEKAKVDMFAGVLMEFMMSFIKPMFSPDTVKDELIVSIIPKIEPIAAFLGEKNFLMGDNVTYVDFCLYEALLKLDWLTN